MTQSHEIYFFTASVIDWTVEMILFHLSSLIVSAVEYRPLLHVTGEIIQWNGIKLVPLLTGIEERYIPLFLFGPVTW